MLGMNQSLIHSSAVPRKGISLSFQQIIEKKIPASLAELLLPLCPSVNICHVLMNSHFPLFKDGLSETPLFFLN